MQYPQDNVLYMYILAVLIGDYSSVVQFLMLLKKIGYYNWYIILTLLYFVEARSIYHGS